MYGEEYGEYAYWCLGVKGWESTKLAVNTTTSCKGQENGGVIMTKLWLSLVLHLIGLESGTVDQSQWEGRKSQITSDT